MSVPDFGPPGYPETFPGVVRCAGGWFAMQSRHDSASGPWRTEAAAKLALAGDYDGAHALEPAAR